MLKEQKIKECFKKAQVESCIMGLLRIYDSTQQLSHKRMINCSGLNNKNHSYQKKKAKNILKTGYPFSKGV